jgi:fructose-1,6-bisphosphatase/inositol monophosphatase family enzyme
MKNKIPPVTDLLHAGIEIVQTIVKWGNIPARRLTKELGITQIAFKDPNNLSREIDAICHKYAVLCLKQEFGDNLFIYGEEARTPPSLSRLKRTVAIFDALDGTDLVARGFNNWCSALVFFHPAEKDILAAIVGHCSGVIYYASNKGAFRKTLGDEKTKTSRTPLKIQARPNLKLENASICFYGQKPAAFLKNSNALSQILEEFKGRMLKKEKLPFRLYNFGGNPMMVKIPDRTVDVAFETLGQRAHDVIPGAYIATQAGAVMTDLNGKPIDLKEALLSPYGRLTYILAATNSLAGELRTRLSKPTTEGLQRRKHRNTVGNL